MQLLIDTTEKSRLTFKLFDGNTEKASFRKATEKLSESLLPELSKFLKKHNTELKDLKKILVNPGPGAFSATRTGVAVANALAYALNIPVAEWPAGRIKKVVLPKYDKAPNITRSKKNSSPPPLWKKRRSSLSFPKRGLG